MRRPPTHAITLPIRGLRAADALTIITTCKKLGHDPRRYIRDTLKRLLDGEKNLNALLPENYKPDVALPAAADVDAAA